jgi:hypothetical protein
MNDLLKNVKQLAIVRALAYISMGKPKVKACALCGISVTTFDRALEDNPDLADDFVTLQKGEITAMYEDVTSTRRELIKRLLAMASSPELELREALSLEERLRMLQQSMEAELSLTTETGLAKTSINNAAEDFLTKLKGPNLIRGRNVVRQTTVTLELDLESSDVGNNVIDGVEI